MREPGLIDYAETLYQGAGTRVRRGTRGHSRGDPRGHQSVVVKQLDPDAFSGAALARLQHEFQVNQALTSPYIARALEYDEFEHQIVFEDRGCRSLRERILAGDLSLDARLNVAIRIATALQSIHDEGVIHRDINPGNLIISDPPAGQQADDPAAYIIDFGFATLASRAPSPALPSEPMTGTLAYMSPEQTGRVNRVVDHRTDLYALGATLYELFTGSLPFTQTDPLELVHAHIASTPKALRETNPSLPQWLSDLVLKLLAKQPEQRYQSASAVRDDLIAAR
ncbi:MAG: serine/threonine protein kinase, partial [Gammaproteobacteria bacterium]